APAGVRHELPDGEIPPRAAAAGAIEAAGRRFHHVALVRGSEFGGTDPRFADPLAADGTGRGSACPHAPRLTLRVSRARAALRPQRVPPTRAPLPCRDCRAPCVRRRRTAAGAASPARSRMPQPALAGSMTTRPPQTDRSPRSAPWPLRARPSLQDGAARVPPRPRDPRL